MLLSREGGATVRVAHGVGEALPFATGSVDAVVCTLTLCSVLDPPKVLAEVARVLKPGGHFLCATWCHREEDGKGSRGPLTQQEHLLLGRICANYFLPAWVPASRYPEAAREAGAGLRVAAPVRSWNDAVAPFWPAVLRAAVRPGTIARLLLGAGGWSTVSGGATAWLMHRGFATGAIDFAAFALAASSARKTPPLMFSEGVDSRMSRTFCVSASGGAPYSSVLAVVLTRAWS